MGMYFPKTVRELIMSNKHWTESTQPSENCRANEAMQVECNDGCQGGEMCLNKRIQKCEVKRVRKEERGEKGFGLFADENIKKGEYVMEYTGKIVQKHRKCWMENLGSNSGSSSIRLAAFNPQSR
jgi:SET domain-containing protein